MMRVLSAMLALATWSMGQPIVLIDDFKDPFPAEALVLVEGESEIIKGWEVPHVLGGARRVTLFNLGGMSGAEAIVGPVEAGSGRLLLDAQPETFMYIDWDGSTEMFDEGLGGVDLTRGGAHDRLHVVFASAEALPGHAQLVVRDTEGGHVLSGQFEPTTQNFEFMFEPIADVVDLTKVSSLQLVLKTKEDQPLTAVRMVYTSGAPIADFNAPSEVHEDVLSNDNLSWASVFDTSGVGGKRKSSGQYFGGDNEFFTLQGDGKVAWKVEGGGFGTASMNMIWDGTDDDPAEIRFDVIEVDSTHGGSNDRFYLVFTETSALQSEFITIGVTDVEGNQSIMTLPPPSTTPTIVEYDFDSFAPAPGSDPADFSRIGGFVLAMNGDPSTSLAITSFGPGFGPVEGCPGDIDGDGELTILDFIAYQNLFILQDPAADCTEDNVWNILDFVCFQNVFSLGCG